MSQRAIRRSFVCTVLIGFHVWAIHASAEDLRRRGMMGVQLAPVSEETKATLKLDSTKGVLVSAVVPESAAAAAGAQSNDIIRKIGADPIDDLPALFVAMRKYYGGDKLALTVLREGAEKTLELTLKPRPQHTPSQFELMYDSAGEPGQRVRTFVSKPSSDGKKPAVLVINSMNGAQSIEGNFPGAHPMMSLVHGLSGAGYVTMRMERLGVGDSEGTDVQAVSVAADAASYRAALAKLRSYDFVDPNRVFVFAHGMAATMVPSIVKDQKIAGVLTFAGIQRPWPTALGDAMRRRWKLELIPDDEQKTKSEALKTFLDAYVGKKEKPADILAKTPDLAKALGDGIVERDFVIGMPVQYGREMAELPGTSGWSGVQIPVLAIWGEADFVADKGDSQSIAEAVNKSNPGKATFLSLPETDHNMGKAVDQEESFLSGNGLMDPKFVEILTKWMSEHSGQGT